MQVAHNFILQEFVPRFMLKEYGFNRCMQWINPQLFKLAQFNKDFFSSYFDEEVKVVINNWKWGGERNLSGLRPHHAGLVHKFSNTLNTVQYQQFDAIVASMDPQEKEIVKTGSFESIHKQGGAIDPKFYFARTNEEIPADDIRKIIKENEEEFMQHGLTTLESGEYAPAWVHQDMRPLGISYILIVEPNN